MHQDSLPSPKKWVSSFGRRKGRGLNQDQKEVLGGFYHQLAIPAAVEGQSLEDPTCWFQQPVDDVWLEIGFGKGEHLLGQAYNHKQIGFIGCETYVSGLSAFLVVVEKQGYQNIVVSDDDARHIVERVKDHSLGKVFILFPDPWPKTRHQKRRLINTAFLDLLATKMKAGAELRVATDHQDYAQWSIYYLTRHSAFEWLAESQTDWQTPPSDWVRTRYQAKAEKQGRGAVYLRFVHKPYE